MKKILTFIVSLLIAVTLTACSSGDYADIAGTYELTKMEASGQTVTPDDEIWKTATGGKSATMNLKDDGSCSVDLFGQTGDGSFKVNDTTVTITIENDPQDFTLEDGNLTVEMSGTKMIFEKK